MNINHVLVIGARVELTRLDHLEDLTGAREDSFDLVHVYILAEVVTDFKAWGQKVDDVNPCQ